MVGTVAAAKCSNQQELLMLETQCLTHQENELMWPDFSSQLAIFNKFQAFLEVNIVEHSGVRSWKE